MSSNLFEKNLYLLEETYKKRIPYLQSYPTNLTIPVSDCCNLSCFMCGPGQTESKYQLSITPEAYERCLPLFPYLKRIELEGTELFHRETETRADWFMKEAAPFEQLKLYGATNGMLINDQRAAAIVKQFGSLSLAIDSCDPDLFHYTKEGGELALLEKNIKRINDFKKKHNLEPQDAPHLQFSAIALRSTFRGLPDLVRWVAKQGGTFLSLRPLAQDVDDASWENIRKKEDIFIRDELTKELHDTVVEAKKVAAEVGVTFYDLIYRKIRQIQYEHDLIDEPVLETESPDTHSGVCNYGWSSLYILSSGTATFSHCSRRVLGNINKQDITSLWNGEAAKDERRNYLGYHYSYCTSVCEKGYGAHYKPVNRKEGFWERLRRRRGKPGRYPGILP